MSNEKEQKLFAEFPPVSTEQWEEVIVKDLKGADYEKKLVWRTAEGFNVRPYYRAEDLKNVKFLNAGVAEFPYVRSVKKCNNWRVVQTLWLEDPIEANKAARKAIENGAESIAFHVNGKKMKAADLDVMLDGIDPNSVEIIIRGCEVKMVAGLLIEKAEREGWDTEKSKVVLICDPIMKLLSLRGGFPYNEDGAMLFAALHGMIAQCAKYKKWRLINVNAYNFQYAGATIVQELAFTLAVGHEYLLKMMEMKLPVDEVAQAIRFAFAVSPNYFMEIAKFRAARMLWANIVNAYAPKKEDSRKMMIHAVTSRWSMTKYDPYVNMLRVTTEAMSAAVAGVHSLEVLPFDIVYERPTEFSYRIARNVQLLLKHEAHFDNVTDAAGGSYYIENLTQQIADQAWELFKQIEDRGGYIKAFKIGFIKELIDASAAKKDKEIATRRITLLGTNQFPNFTEKMETTGQENTCDTPGFGFDGACYDFDVTPDTDPLRIYRAAEPFEELRMKVDASGKEPKAFMLTCGTLGMARARSQFSSNFFGCAGIRIIDNTFFNSVEEGAKAALASGADIVVVCAADDDYAELAPKVKELIGDKAILVVAGAPASQPELEAQGIKNFISVRSNVLETLRQYVKELGIK